MLKITGGELRGRVIKAPPGLGTRPTAAKMRQALFNILGPAVDQARVADFFAGSGALGLEALSRGAAACLFVEKSTAVARLLRANLEALDLAERGRVLTKSLAAAAPALEAQGPFDLVLADPPYNRGQVAKLLALVAERKLLAPRGRLIVEHAPQERPEAPSGLRASDLRRYGQSELSFFTPRE
ncbi:MAG: 16S rRNA (guanine(966)-N(2))-methyltransferase RsmD [Desulfarculaceae bacterium]|nr:16S rRNA (guanine(966)-N(2))-methyltransferase RsmD [Desulfarculaceae bacterium]MCF8070996.1 16S rRNA (guanine(966)-N(2))-methyltransferase RsmD [Desulfarculaceae bacterium]MCF8100584.1 16S rRNA (guanine(966)-N(2))-methyltransferase RsmD [Desulfarculaceae bacterium]